MAKTGWVWMIGAASLFVLLCGAGSANAQTRNGAAGSPEPCGAANGGGANSTNYYGGGNPCRYRYSIPEENMNRVLSDAHYCSMFSRTQVNCSQPLRGNYGQLQSGANETARGGVVAGGGQGTAEQYWQRASALIERNNYRDAIPLLTQAAKMGHPRAQATLGIAYQDGGNGVRRDDRAAAYWFGLAAAQGHRASQYALGGMYEEGEGGLVRDQRKAMELYLASAKQGFDKAEEIVGLSYLIGDGLPNDKRQGIAWLQKAAAQGLQLSKDLAIVVLDRSAPASFANMNALNAYLARVHQQEMARQAARGGGGRQDEGVVARINAVNEANQWRASHGCMSCGAYIPK
ncbi:MAG TPA: tetratricopeptide repeat protein [Acidobacteriaceae bacterium]